MLSTTGHWARVCLAFVLATAAITALAQTRKLPPLKAFFDEGSVQDMQQSPNGRWVAAQLVPEGGGNLRLVMIDLQGKEPAKVVAAFSRANVRSFYWLNDDMLIVTAYQDRYRGRDRRSPATLAVPRDGSSMRLLIKAELDSLFAAAGGAQPMEANHEVLAAGIAGTDDIIVGETLYDGGLDIKAVRPLLVNARTGTRRTLLKNEPDRAVSWLFDHKGQARLATTERENNTAYHWFDLEKQTWTQIASFQPLEVPYTPQFVDGAGQLYVTTSNDDGSGRELRLFDFAKGKPGDDVLLRTPGFSGGITEFVDRSTGQLLGMRMDTDAALNVWLAPELDALQKKVDAALPGRVNQLRCARCTADQPVLVFSYSDRAPGDFLLFDAKSGGLQRLGAVRPAIDPAAMSPMLFTRIRARDGADLPMYVTLPDGDKTRARPAVVLVHGGPWSRGRLWGWNGEVQFLASRGYVVIEPEFRGSTGYGSRHFRAGFRQWGQAMQDDVSDALAHAVKQGWVDPARVCIAGGSYGGYATLMGLAKTPDQYRCGVAWVAVSDPRLMFSLHYSDVPPEAKKYSMKTMIGDPDKDAAMFAANAPLALADRIRSPLLLAYGGKDLRVPIDHGERMRDALAKAGRPPEWILYPDEGHVWNFEENTFDFWTKVEAFLAKHNKP